MPETTYTITKKTVESTPTIEHPSLTLNQPILDKSAAEILSSLNSDVRGIKEHVASLKEQASTIEAEFNSLDALTILANIETKIDIFIQRYDAVLSKAEANLDLEREALSKLVGLAGKT